MNTSRVTRFEVKSIDEEARTFAGLASTWDLDLGGDVIKKGAFRDTLKDWRTSGAPMPLLDSHNGFASVRAAIGKMMEAKETDDGLEATFELIDGPDGDEVYRRIKGGYVTGLSIGYEPKEIETPGEEDKRKGIWRILKKVNLREVSVVLWPMNQSARIRDVKGVLESAFDGVDPDTLTDDDRQDLRKIAGRVGSLLRPPAPEGAPAAEDKDAPPTPATEPAAEPQVPPGPPADAPKADTETEAVPAYVAEALSQRISAIRLQATRLNLSIHPIDEGDNDHG